MHERPNLVLSAEEELGITAGLQDRVVQVYGGVVYMDFDRDHMQAHGYGRCCTSSSYTNACLKTWIH
jgi:glucuronokinase